MSQHMPPAHPFRGLVALGTVVLGNVARRFGWTRAIEFANRPVMTLSDQQPVTATWWRARRKTPGDLFIIAVGDSTAQGIGASRPGNSYVGQLVDRMEAYIGAPVHVTNLAVSGATTALCARDQLPRLVNPLTKHPEVVTVAIGANDIAQWDPVAFHRNLSEILDAVPEHALVAELPCFFTPRAERRVRTANRILHTLADARGLTVVPLHAATRARGLRGILTEFAADGFHPSDSGYAVWADTFWPYVRERVDATLRARSTAAEAAG
ncbi:hypothetical protein K8P10_000495 [Leucobacter sp. Psy1]|uniref:SGNH/GDSL hydrolase family protein n=1 Tax=Leucobacter sp. Psy1 TaxID=2875729 RepID=UPI001CD6084A|nr:SGNH/GDSL hydrolase family protein [Leucobacter sp. Psy1]UBH04984.1 hypothetical protein K8P10_000495 [Leucobacter sp. Psy1]